MQDRRYDLSWAWTGALALFVLAGTTGVLYRFGIVVGFPGDLQSGNVRHAHSHLMYFGWVTPALMALVATRLPDLTGRPLSAWVSRVIGATLVVALLAYFPFLLYGYQPAEIAGRRLPIAVIAAGLNILAWYAFAGLYAGATWGVPRGAPLRLWDAALGFLGLASMGAWGRGVLVALEVDDPFWAAASVHLFLDLFADGWLLLALLGLLYAAYPAAEGRGGGRWGPRLIVCGLPLTFLLGIWSSLVPSALRLVAGAGGILVAFGLFGSLRALWPPARSGRGEAWRLPLIFLAIKAVALLGISLPLVARWGERVGLRVPYLHWMLLGFVTLGLVAAARDVWGEDAVRGWRGMQTAVVLLLATLFPLTALWPATLAGRWVLVVAAWAALGPVVVGVGMAIHLWRVNRARARIESAARPRAAQVEH